MIHHDRGTKRSVQGQNRPSAPPGRFLWNIHFCPFVSGLPMLPRFVHWPAGRREANARTTAKNVATCRIARTVCHCVNPR